MDGDATLPGMIAARAHRDPDRPAFVFDGAVTTLGELDLAVRRFASRLRSEGLEDGERVLLALPNGGDLLAAFFGVQRAGGVAVPLFPGSGPERLRRFAELCGARRLVAADDGGSGLRLLRPDATSEPGPERPEPDPDGLAFLQYTSGSTGDPKGVELTHRRVLANLRHLIDGFEITTDDVFVSWLPMHHDMGLVLMTLVPLFLGAKLVLLPTQLAHPGRWLDAIADHRGTFTAAPDFAWRICLRTVKDPSRWDLQSLRVALNAAEPVRERTIAEFAEAFGRPRTMIAGYGLAEATVGVSSQPPGTAPKVDERGFVSVGRPFPGVEVAILDRDNEGEGEILVRSAATTRGYFQNPEATAALHWRDGWIRTGDLGYRDADGDLFIVGRLKDVILHGGRNLAPSEVEELVDPLPAVRRSAAVGIDRGRLEGEQVYVFAELRPRTPEASWPEVVRTIVEGLHRELGLRPARVFLVKARTLPMTANGKLRHGELRKSFLDGRLRSESRILFPDY